MVEMRLAAAMALAVVLGMAPGGRAHAIPVFDWANLQQNLTSAKLAVEQVNAAYRQIEQQRLQLIAMERQLKSMEPAQVIGLVGEVAGIQELRDIERALLANQDLIQGINQVKKGFDERLDTAQLLKLTWKEYVMWEHKRILRKEEGAVARVRAEAHAMRRIESDYEFARRAATQISKSSGVHEAVQQMNTQMNRVIQQNAELMRQLATAFGGSSAEKEMQDAEDRARARAAEDAYRGLLDTARTADQTAIETWKSEHRR